MDQKILAILEKGAHVLIGQRLAQGTFFKDNAVRALPQAVVVAAQPQHPVAVGIEAVIIKGPERIGLQIHCAATVVRIDIDLSPTFIEGQDYVGGKTLLVSMPERNERIAVKAVKTSGCAHPNEAIAVPEDASDGIVGKPIGNGQGTEPRKRSGRCQAQGGKQQKQYQ